MAVDDNASRTSVDDMVVLVVDQEHQRHGQIGRMLYHDWRESGDIGVSFSDGSMEQFYDGIMNCDSHPKIKRFYRHRNILGTGYDEKNVGPASFQKEFAEHGGSPEKLAEQYRALFHDDSLETRFTSIP